MKYGLIGEKLGHSFSKDIHSKLKSNDYELTPIKPEELETFMRKKDFSAINVTIPYKQSVMQYLDHISPEAMRIGAVNVVVNKDGVLYGYNSDYEGLKRLIAHKGVSLAGKKVLIAGSGGTSHTAACLAENEGAKCVLTLSRTGRNGGITYDEAYEKHSDADIIINTTPSGMFPDNDSQPIDLAPFCRLEAVFDVIFNPLRTRLVLDAQSRGIVSEGGLYMLVAQAVGASELFTGEKYEDTVCDAIYNELLSDKQNIVLVGMPSSGKTTVGRSIAEKTGREFIDIDDLIPIKSGRSIKEIFATDGEKAFRDIESECVKDIRNKNGIVIACGGGTVLREENVKMLKSNGRIFLLDRDISELIPTSSRPLSSNIGDLQRLYDTRMPIYKACADSIVKCVGYDDADERIIKEFYRR